MIGAIFCKKTMFVRNVAFYFGLRSVFSTKICRSTASSCSVVETPKFSTKSGSTVPANCDTRRRKFDLILPVCFNTTTKRFYCAPSNTSIPVAKYDEIKDLPNHPEKLLIDVREPEELVQFGQIPTSINIPLNSLRETLISKFARQDFKVRFNRDFPDLSDEIIFMCQKGIRAQTGAEIAKEIGFKNVKNYKGSWVDWAEQEGIPPSE